MHTLSDLQRGLLAGASHIKLAEQLTEFPREIFSLADTLEILDLSGNQLSALPDDFPRLQRLRILFLSNNLFTSLPDVLARCPNLTMVGFKSNQIQHIAALPPHIRWLILTDNQLNQLPEDIGHYHALQKLMLSGNQLRYLPDSMAHCHNLQLLRLAANQLQQLPEWLTQLPQLAWLAYAGNPASAMNSVADDLPQLNWSDLQIEQRLGEGASGWISRAHWQTEQVAVKAFKGQVTSDGYPADEMAAALAAGQHPSLPQPLGKLAQPAGLVFALISPTFQTLAGPPSFDSCTRDVYASHQTYSAQVVRHILRDVATAAAHLHQRGIMHGDLYGHNILVNAQGHSLLSDFGAATRYARQLGDNWQERLEVRAFGYLMEELLARCQQDLSLHTLRDHCLHPDPMQRPDFAQVVGQLTD